MESTATHMTIEDFMTRFRDEGPFEILDGEIVAMTPQAADNSRLTFRLARWLADYVDQHRLGEVFVEASFVLLADPDWVTGSRIPDAMFIRAERLAALRQAKPDWGRGPVPLVPDLVMEVASPSDRLSAVNKKIALYLADGVSVIWLVEPEAQTVTVYLQGSNQQTRLTVDQTLTGGDVVPGFSANLKQLFDLS